jgi:hypothetical protein
MQYAIIRQAPLTPVTSNLAQVLITGCYPLQPKNPCKQVKVVIVTIQATIIDTMLLLGKLLAMIESGP